MSWCFALFPTLEAEDMFGTETLARYALYRTAWLSFVVRHFLSHSAHRQMYFCQETIESLKSGRYSWYDLICLFRIADCFNELFHSLKYMHINYTCNRLLDSLVVECWRRVREVAGSIPSHGPRHTKDVINMVTVVPLFSTQHWEGKYWHRSGIEILRSRRSLAVVAAMKNTIDHAEPTKVER